MIESWQEPTEGPRELRRALERLDGIGFLRACIVAGWRQEPNPVHLAEIITWFCERYDRYISPRSERGWEWWTPVDWEAIRGDIANARYETEKMLERRRQAERLRAEGERFPTLDAWLDGGGYRATIGPEEQPAYRLLKDAACRRYWDARKRVDHARIRVCACGGEFTGVHRGVKRCPSCRAITRRSPAH